MTHRIVLIALVAALVSGGCSIKRMAINSLADTLSSSGDVFSSDEDPELVRDAVPFSLKTLETLLAQVPNHSGLLLSSCSGFTQYAYAFIQADAEMLGAEDFTKAEELKARALKMYLRGRDYCLRAMELKHPGIGAQLLKDAKAALATTKIDEVPLLYWIGASWGAAVSLGLDKPELVNALPAVRALMERALELDEDYAKGAIHEAMISLDSLSDALGGSPDRARKHFERAVQLQESKSPGPYVALAMGVSVPGQNRAEFEKLLNQAVGIDPAQDRSNRLATLITQRRARKLLERIDELFSTAHEAGGAAFYWAMRK